MEIDAPGKKGVPEVDLYFCLLTMVYLLLDQKQHAKGLQLSMEVVELVQNLNRRTSDTLASMIYFYYSLFHEVSGKLSDCFSYFILEFFRTFDDF